MVQLGGSILGLHGIDFRCIMYVVSEEVDGLAGRVDFCLENVLALAKHSGSIHNRTIFRGK